MKKIIVIIVLIITGMMAVSCGHDDEPQNGLPIDGNINPDTTIFTYTSTDDFMFWPIPTIDDSGLSGEGYDFDYWRQHKAEAGSFETLMAMCNIPADLLANMSTRNLAITCLNYPYNSLFHAYNDQYWGFKETIKYFNGYHEIMKRYGGKQATIDLYAELGDTYQAEGTSVSSWTFFLCTAVDLKALSNEQIADLSKAVLWKIDHYTDSNELFQLMNLAHSYLLGALIAYHYDSSLTVEQLNWLKYYISSVSRQYFFSHTDYLDNVYAITTSSLQRFATAE